MKEYTAVHGIEIFWIYQFILTKQSSKKGLISNWLNSLNSYVANSTTVQAHKSTKLTSQGTQTELGMRSWRANTHKVDVKEWKSFSNINCSLLAYVTYLMYVSQDSKTARVTCSNQHMSGTFQVLTYWVKQQVQGEEQHECISIFHSPGSWKWETFCSCQRQYQLYTETLRYSGCSLCVLLEKNTTYVNLGV